MYIKDEPLLIISDEYNADLVAMMERSASRVVMWKCEGKCAPDQLSIDMLSAVPAKRFFGSPLSTFSGGIQQWRNRCRPHSIVQVTLFPLCLCQLSFIVLKLFGVKATHAAPTRLLSPHRTRYHDKNGCHTARNPRHAC